MIKEQDANISIKINKRKMNMTFHNNVNLKMMHNRRYNHHTLVKLNKYWQHYCQERESKGLQIINNATISKTSKILNKVLKYNYVLNKYPRNSKRFTHFDNKEQKLLFNNLSIQGYSMIIKLSKHALSHYEIAEIIALCMSTKDIDGSKWISKRIAKKIISKVNKDYTFK